MTPVQLLALSLGLSVAVAALGLAAMRLLDRRVADPVIRERAWGAVLHLSALPPVIVVALMMLPPQVRSINAAAVQFEASAAALSNSERLPSVLSALEAHGATLILAVGALLVGLRVIVLLDRLLRLRGLLAASTPAGPDLRRIIDETARRMRVAAPTTRVSGTGSEAFLAGLRTPILVIPAALAAGPDRPETRTICAHELAHLKRGDHRALWLEEALLSALAINPLLGLIRDHRAAAREEACDAVALAGADAEMRRQYARSLLAALQDPAFGRDVPALTFTSARRTFVMRRLKAILSPVSPSGRRSRLVMTGVSVLIAGVAGAGSLAVAAQREPVMVARVAPAPAAATNPPAAPAPAAARVAEPVAPIAPPAPPRREVAPEPPALPVQTAEPVASVITNPAWAQHAVPQYPAAAVTAGVNEGRVRLTCTAEADGQLSDCSIVSETPVGAGFGEAAIEATRTARLSPDTIESFPAGSKVSFGMRFRFSS